MGVRPPDGLLVLLLLLLWLLLLLAGCCIDLLLCHHCTECRGWGLDLGEVGGRSGTTRFGHVLNKKQLGYCPWLLCDSVESSPPVTEAAPGVVGTCKRANRREHDASGSIRITRWGVASGAGTS